MNQEYFIDKSAFCMHIDSRASIIATARRDSFVHLNIYSILNYYSRVTFCDFAERVQRARIYIKQIICAHVENNIQLYDMNYL